MNLAPQTIIIVDVKNIIAKYEQNPTVAEQLPWIDVQTVLALGLSQVPTAGGSEETLVVVEKLIIAKGCDFFIPTEFFDTIEHLLNSSVEDVDELVRYYGQTRHIDHLNVTFLKWIDHHTLALGCYYGPHTNTYNNFRASREAALAYISQTTGIPIREFGGGIF